MSLEEILRIYFDCRKPFKTNGDFTKAGWNAYDKLTNSLSAVGALTGCEIGRIVDKLDEITNIKQ